MLGRRVNRGLTISAYHHLHDTTLVPGAQNADEEHEDDFEPSKMLRFFEHMLEFVSGKQCRDDEW